MLDIILLYLFTRLDVLAGFSRISAAAGFIGLIIYAIARAEEMSPESKGLRQWFKVSVWSLCLGIVTILIVPTKTDMAIIVGGKLALDVGRSETAKEISSEVLAAIRQQLRKAAQ